MCVWWVITNAYVWKESCLTSSIHGLKWQYISDDKTGWMHPFISTQGNPNSIYHGSKYKLPLVHGSFLTWCSQALAKSQVNNFLSCVLYWNSCLITLLPCSITLLVCSRSLWFHMCSLYLALKRTLPTGYEP